MRHSSVSTHLLALLSICSSFACGFAVAGAGGPLAVRDGSAAERDVLSSVIRDIQLGVDGVTLDRVAEVLSGAEVTGTNLNLSVESGGDDVVYVAPGGTVRYEVIGVLSDDANLGLALVGFDLVFDGGDLPHADIPAGEPTPGCDHPMRNFTRPWGITNPDEPCPPACGFGGTIIDGALVQLGGGQNALLNMPDNAPAPIGPVLLGVAAPGGCGPAVLVTGSFVAPTLPGTYALAIRDVFANGIREGETGDPFWAVVAAGVGTISDLTVVVVDFRLDIKPGSCPNVVNPRGKGVLPIALAGTADFDVREVDTTSLTVSRADGVGGVVAAVPRRGRSTVGLEDVTSPSGGGSCECGVSGGDGLDDLVLHVPLGDLSESLELHHLSREARVALTLRGRMIDGTSFDATDCVLITGRASGGSRLRQSGP